MRTEEECIIWFRNHGILTAFLDNMSQQITFHELYEINHGDMINAAFSWIETPQGQEFWRNFNNEFHDWFNDNEPNLRLRAETPEGGEISWRPIMSGSTTSRVFMDINSDLYTNNINSIIDNMQKTQTTRRAKKEVNSKFKKNSKVKLVTVSSKFVESNDDMNDMKNKTVTICRICEHCYDYDEKDKKFDGCFYYIEEDGGTNSYTSEMFEK